MEYNLLFTHTEGGFWLTVFLITILKCEISNSLWGHQVKYEKNGKFKAFEGIMAVVMVLNVLRWLASSSHQTEIGALPMWSIFTAAQTSYRSHSCLNAAAEKVGVARALPDHYSLQDDVKGGWDLAHGKKNSHLMNDLS